MRIQPELVMAEGVGFFVGIFTVIGGLIFIMAMGLVSIYYPYKGIAKQPKFKKDLEVNPFPFCSANMSRARRPCKWQNILWCSA